MTNGSNRHRTRGLSDFSGLSLWVMWRTRVISKLTIPVEPLATASVNEKKEAQRQAEPYRRQLAYRSIGYFVMGAGVIALALVSTFQSDVIRLTLIGWFSISRNTPLHLAVILAWIGPGIYLLAVVFLTYENKNVSDPTRNKYLDAVKTLITAAGLTIAIVISTSLKPEHAPPGWVATVRDAVVALSTSMGFSVVTLFLLSFLYDRAVARTLRLTESVTVVPFFYLALAKFLLGFIYMVRLTYLLT